MILPKLSAALLSMSSFGSAYASASWHGHTSLEQWVVISGAANGAAALFDADPDDLALHRRTARKHLTRYASERGLPLAEFEPLFDCGLTEGRKLVANRGRLFQPRQREMLAGFHHDKIIAYPDMRRALVARS